MKGVGRPSLENTTSRNDGVSGSMLQASLCCSENVAAKPQFSISTPPQQRLPVEKALEEGVNALKFGGLGQALHAVPMAPFDSSRSNTARGEQLLALLKNFGPAEGQRIFDEIYGDSIGSPMQTDTPKSQINTSGVQIREGLGSPLGLLTFGIGAT